MKSFLNRLLFVSLILFFSVESQAQLTASFVYGKAYSTCGENVLTIKVSSSSSTAIGPIVTEFNLNSKMAVQNVTSDVQNSFTIVTGNKVRIVFDTLLTSAGGLTFHVGVKSLIACAQSGCTGALSTSDSLYIRYNSKSELTVNKRNLLSPCLTYDQNLFSNRLVSAFLGDTITRKIVLLNTGAGTFDGSVQLNDTYGAYVEVDTIYSLNSQYILGSYSKPNDSTVSFTASFQSVKNNDSIVLIEKVIVRKCIKNEEGKSLLTIRWGCDASLCNTISPSPIIAQILKNNKKPLIEITRLPATGSNCLNSASGYYYIIKNKGLRPAVNLKLELANSDYNTYTYVDKQSLALKDTSGLSLVYSVAQNFIPKAEDWDFQHSCTIAQPIRKWQFGIKSLAPQDSFIVEYNGYSCCPASDTTNQPLTFEGWFLTANYQNECEEEDFYTASGLPPSNILSLNQFYEPKITDMNGLAKDTASFKILNYAFTSDFYRINKDSMKVKVVLKLDTGLVYVSNTMRITSTYNYNLTPTSVSVLSGGLPEGYADDVLEASFILPDTFKKDPGFFERYFRNSSVVFSLTARCPAKPTSSRFTQELYFTPDLNCTQSCEILVSTVTQSINVHCPGCITPGWIANAYTVRRLTLGERDDDNNRLPDHATFVQPDLTKIKLNRYLPGDTIETELNAFLVDGNPTTGRTIQQLRNNGANSFEFNHCYLKTNLSMGKLYQLNAVTVIIKDIDKSVLSDGADTLTLPSYTVSRKSNPNDSLPDATLLYDLSLDTLFKYGLTPGYTFDVFDEIKVRSNFTILEFSRYYASIPPTDKDPWLLMEDIPLIIQGFGNLIYLSGRHYTIDDPVIEAGTEVKKNPALLNGNMIYWCEGHGGVGTLVGRNKTHVINMPGDISCMEKGLIRLTVNASGGVFKNTFPFEYRKLIGIDSIQAYVPPGYTFKDWIITNTIYKFDQFQELEPCSFTDTLKNVRQQGILTTVGIDNAFKTRTAYPASTCIDALVYGDESMRTDIVFSVVPDCDLSDGKSFYPSPELYYHHMPNRQSETLQLSLPPSFNKINASLRLTPLTNEIQLSQKTICYQLNIEEYNGAHAYHPYLKVKSTHNKFDVVSLTDIETDKVYLPDKHGMFRMDSLIKKSVYQYTLCLSNICGETIDRDTLLLIYGNDCFTYPDSLFSNICKVDTVMHIVIPAFVDMQGTVEGPEEITMCQPFDIQYHYQITGVGKIENMVLQLQKELFTGISIQSASIETGGVSASVLSTLNKKELYFDMGDVIKTIKPAGLKAGDHVTVHLKLNTDCTYKGLSIVSQGKLVTSTCDTLYSDSIRYTPLRFKGYPEADTVLLSTFFNEFKNYGGITEVAISIKNAAASISKNKKKISLFLPPGFTYNSTVTSQVPSLTDTSVVWNLPAGIAVAGEQLITVKLNYAPIAHCDSVRIKIVAGDLSEGCNQLPCVQKDSAYFFKRPVTCYPCPPVVSVADRCKGLPVYNTVQWTYVQHAHCPEDVKYTYSLYYSPEYAGTYTLIKQTSDTFFVHQSISSYDGCYYVTVKDSLGLSSEKSDIVCHKTCLDQFRCADLKIYNLVTDNNDQQNDYFTITGAYVPLKVDVYNAWGDAVFKSGDYKNDWNGENLSEGIYFYHVSVNGSDEKCNGWVQIVK